MAHPDHDQVIGRLAGARLHGSAARRSRRRPVEPHPDAETWAAYVDGGLLPDEVGSLETHLAACAVCRRLVAVLVPEVSTAAAPVVRSAEPAASGPATIICVSPAPGHRVDGRRRRPVRGGDALVGVAAGQRCARLGSGRDDAARPAPRQRPMRPRRPPARPSAAAAARREAPAAERDARQSAAAAPRASAPADLRQARRPDAGAGARPPLRSVGSTRRRPKRSASTRSRRRSAPTRATSRCRRTRWRRARARAARSRCRPTSSSNAAPVAAPRHARAPRRLLRPRRSRRAGARAGAMPAAARRARAPARNEQAVGQVAEAVTTTGAAVARPAPARPERAQAAGGGGMRSRRRRGLEGRSGEDAGLRRRGVRRALPSFAEPGGRLRWRIADGRRLESSSDGGATWDPATRSAADAIANGHGRLRAGTAPAIDSAWAVGERGLVLRFSVPGRLDGRGAAGCGDADRGVGDRRAVGAGHRRRRPRLRDHRRRRDVDARDARGWSPVSGRARPRGRQAPRAASRPGGRVGVAVGDGRRADHRAAGGRRAHARPRTTGASSSSPARSPAKAVRARIDRVERGVAFARVEAVLTPSPDRRAPFFDPGVRRRRLRARRPWRGRLVLKRDVILDGLRARRRPRLGAAAHRRAVARARLPAAGAPAGPRGPHRLLQGRHATSCATRRRRRSSTRARSTSAQRLVEALARCSAPSSTDGLEISENLDWQRAGRAPPSDRPRAGRDDAAGAGRGAPARRRLDRRVGGNARRRPADPRRQADRWPTICGGSSAGAARRRPPATARRVVLPGQPLPRRRAGARRRSTRSPDGPVVGSLRRRRAVRRGAGATGRDRVTAVEGDPVSGARSAAPTPRRSAARLAVEAPRGRGRAGGDRAAGAMRPSSSIRRAPACRRAVARRWRRQPRRASSTCRATWRRWRATSGRSSDAGFAVVGARGLRSVPEHGPRRDAGRARSGRTDVRSSRAPLSRVCVRGVDEAAEQALEFAGPPEVLGVPLHADAEARRRPLDRFDDAVGRELAVTTRPSAELLHRLMMPAVHRAEAVALELRPQRSASSVPGVTSTSWAIALARRSRMRDRDAAGTWLGMSCTSVPPSATFSTCMPRQIARSGRSRAMRRRDQRDLEVVAAGFGDRSEGRVRAPRRRARDRRRRRRAACSPSRARRRRRARPSLDDAARGRRPARRTDSR